MPHIELKNVSKAYGRVQAIDRVNLEIADGEYLTMLGPSGCGKTTTLRAIAGLIQPDEGEILFDGKNIIDLPPDERDIGMVFQHFEIFPFMDIWDNVTYAPRVKGKPESQLEELGVNALKLIGMLPRANNFPEDLSAPELQKIGIARAIATESKLLLLDEPLGALDLKIRMEFQHELRKLVKKLGLTAIHVTHDQIEAMNISDRIAIMRKGHIHQVDTPMNLYYKPNSIFVCNFLSNSNFLECFVDHRETGSSTLRLRGFGPKVKVLIDKWDRMRRLVLAIRKNEISIASELSPDINTLNATIIKRHFLGSKTIFQLRLENNDRIEAEVLTREITKDIKGLNEQIIISFDESDAMCFEYPKDLDYELALE
ncbi:MAG: ABC transporter ATP-binding protein [Candidatus Helarchaeota archaeon]|nr:ABC transporter ATP-binding protein [Candidatus Helarchaeota archaeon]